jgi:hypothetical protein
MKRLRSTGAWWSDQRVSTRRAERAASEIVSVLIAHMVAQHIAATRCEPFADRIEGASIE